MFGTPGTSPRFGVEVISAIVGAAAAFCLAFPSAQAACVTSKINNGLPNGYQDRGDRCEGVYAEEQVGSNILEVKSFTRGKLKYELNGGDLQLEWPATDVNSSLQIRAVSLPQHLHYQMDTIRPPQSASFRWPSQILSENGIQAKDLGVRGWLDNSSACGHKSLKAHVPLRVRQANGVSESTGYWLVMVPGLKLRWNKMYLERLDPQSGTGVIVGEQKDLGGKTSRPSRPVRVKVKMPTDPGFYRVRLLVEADNDELFDEIFCFYHAAS